MMSIERRAVVPFHLALALALAGCASAQQPLRKLTTVPLPGGANRFDYQSLDTTTGRLYLSHMGAGRLVVFDTMSGKVVADLPGYRTVTGVLAVPEEGKLYASAAGTHEVVITDLKTLKVLAHVEGADFPDGIAYAPTERRVFVSDESGAVDLAIDSRTNKALARIPLGGEAGNTHYDPVTGRVWVAVQTRNELVAIDPRSLKVVGRHPLPGSDRPHGFAILNGVAYVSCEGNDRLLVVDLRTMDVSQKLEVSHGPDVLAIDESLRRLYVGCEGGAVDVFRIGTSGDLTSIGRFSAPNAHTVGVDPHTHRVFVALENVGGRPELWILEPTR